MQKISVPGDDNDDLFENDHLYGRQDMVERNLFGSEPSVDNAVERGDLPPGRLYGRFRKWTGRVLNAYHQSRPTEPSQLPRGMGGPQPRAGRPRKPPPPPSAA